MLMGFGWKAFFLSVLAAAALTVLLRLSGCHALIL
jgi:hypothetical protein